MCMGAPRPYPKHTGGVPKYGQGPRLSAANTVGLCLPDATRVRRRRAGLELMLRSASIPRCQGKNKSGGKKRTRSR